MKLTKETLEKAPNDSKWVCDYAWLEKNSDGYYIEYKRSEWDFENADRLNDWNEYDSVDELLEQNESHFGETQWQIDTRE